MLELLRQEITGGLADWTQFARVVIRLLAAMVVGGIIGYQREQAGKSAGLRTHMLVSLGMTVFVLASAGGGLSAEGVSRVIQGLATGIGFIGAGAILKLRDEHQIEGLTTSAGIWATAAVGVAVGLGQLGLALMSVVLALLALSFIDFLGGKRHVSREG
jgi:putative Mg2+ transporter-C (MgtC) family protein